MPRSRSRRCTLLGGSSFTCRGEGGECDVRRCNCIGLFGENTHVGVPEGQQETSCADLYGNGDRVGVKVIPSVMRTGAAVVTLAQSRSVEWDTCLPQCEPERGVDPARREMRKCSRDGGVRGHLTHRAERCIRGRTDEGIGNESTERSSCAERKTRTQEKTGAEGTRDLTELSTRLCNTRNAGDGEGITGVWRPLWGCRTGDSQQSSGHGAA